MNEKIRSSSQDARKKTRQEVTNCAVKDPHRSMSRNAMACWSLRLNKEVDIEQMIKPTSVCSFEFCRWFVAFHSHHSSADGLVLQTMWKLPTSRLRMPPTPPRHQPIPRARTVIDLETLSEDEEDATQKNVACSPIRILWEEEEEQRLLAQRASEICKIFKKNFS